MAAMFGTLASVSRMTWAFARDDGLPFSRYLKHIDSVHKVPARSITLVSTIVLILSLINLGSSTALSAVISLSTIGLYVSYIIPITCLIILRLRVPVTVYSSTAGHADVSEERLVFGPWNLGRWGLIVNLYAVCYAILLVPFMTLPTSLPLTYMTMNYAGPVFGAVILFAIGDWLYLGRKRFTGPKRDR